MYAYALKIYQKICTKTAHFSNQSGFRKKSIKYVLFMVLGGCVSPPATDWRYQSIQAKEPCSLSRYFLPAEDPLKNMEIEWQDQSEEAPLYLNVCGPPLTSPDSTVEVIITVAGQPSSYRGRLMEGNQRLLLPIDAKEKLLDALHNQIPVTIKAGRYSLKR